MTRFKPRRFEIIVVGGSILGLWVLLLLSFGRARNIQRGAVCRSNLKQTGLATMQYVRDYDENYLLANEWREDLLPYSKQPKVFHCLARAANGYAYNRYLHGQSYTRVDKLQGLAKTPLFFESVSLTPNASDFGISWLRQASHHQGTGLVYADGHAEWRHSPPIFRSFAPFSRPKPQKKQRKTNR